MAAISVDSLWKSYANETVLRDIQLEVAEGEFCVIVGPSGCGKSTLLNCIAGLTEYDAGYIHIRDEDVATVDVEDRDIGYVFQEFEHTLFPHMSVEENVAFGLEQQGQGRGEIEKRTGEVLNLLAISETKDDLPGELSGGQQQRVELARQLVRECDVMLFDDPLADLDYKLQKRMELEIRKLHADLGSTFVYVTHNQDQALKLADKLVVMNQGIIEQIAPPRMVYDNPATAFAGRFIGDSNLFHGTVEETDDGEVVAATEVGRVSAMDTNGDVETGDDAVVLVRPENVATGEAARDQTNQFTATLEGSTYTGERTEHAMSVADFDREIQVVEPGRPAVGTTGDRVTIGWDSSDARSFVTLSPSSAVTLDDLVQV